MSKRLPIVVFLLVLLISPGLLAEDYEIDPGEDEIKVVSGIRFATLDPDSGNYNWDVRLPDLKGSLDYNGARLVKGKLWAPGPNPSVTREFDGKPLHVAHPFFATKDRVYHPEWNAAPEFTTLRARPLETLQQLFPDYLPKLDLGQFAAGNLFEIQSLKSHGDGIIAQGPRHWVSYDERGRARATGRGQVEVVDGEPIWVDGPKIGGRGWSYTGGAPIKVRRGWDFILTGEDQDFAVRLRARGRPRFKRPLGGRVKDFVVLESGSTLYALEEQDAVPLVWLDQRGVEKNRVRLDGELKMLSSHFLALSTKMEVPKIYHSGRPVLNLKTGEPEDLSIEGHRLYRIQANQNLEKLSVEPRQALVGPVEEVDGRLIYATQLVPERKEGVRTKVDHRYPYEPILLHSDRWTWESPDRRGGLSRDRIPQGSWPLAGDQLLSTTEDGHLLAISLADGTTTWKSPRPLELDEGVPSFYPQEWGAVLVKTRNGELHYLYAVDPASGQILWQRRLTHLFLMKRLNNLIGVLIVGLALAYFIFAARRRDLFIRRIAGLETLDEAVGRATEMGKPVLYVTGLADVDDIQTLASLSILGHVARKTAEYDTPILVPTSRAVVYSSATEVVKEAFTAAGRPDAFMPDNVRYLTDDQFGYTAGVDGLMLREEPAANFYMGRFYAESLILAETGNATGAIQIAGTAMPSQLPFFVAACDYTLIGEELFAASAYLSKDPLQVGSLRGQDVGKAIVMVCILLGAILVTMDYEFIKDLFAV